MSIHWSNKLRLNYGAPGRNPDSFGLSEPPIDEKTDTAAINKARKYFDEFNNACSISSRHVLAFIHHDGTNIPFTDLKNEELKARMAAGHCLHYTAAGILALELDKKLEHLRDDTSD